MSNQFYYRRHLPHYQPPESDFFVTIRLAGSLPKEVILAIKKKYANLTKTCENLSDPEKSKNLETLQKKHFGEFDKLLDSGSTGPMWLIQPEIRSVIQESLHHRDEKIYHLLAYSIMPNHVHILFDMKNFNVGRPDWSPYRVTEIMENLKWYTALKANRILQRTGSFWQHESYDHVIRENGELERIVIYMLQNPVKAGFVDDWKKWRGNYLKPGLFRL